MQSQESIRYWAGGIGISAVLAGTAAVLLLLQMPAPTPTPKAISDAMTTPRTPLVPRAASTPTSTRTNAASTRTEPTSPTAARSSTPPAPSPSTPAPASSPTAAASSPTAAASSPTAPASANAASSARSAAASAKASATPVKAHITKSATTLSAAERTLSEQIWTEQKKLDAEVVRIAAATPDGGRRATRAIARQFDVPANLVNNLHGQGIGYGEVATSLALSRQLVTRDKVKREQAIERIISARRSGQGWAALAHALDLNLGQVLADVRKTDADVTALLPLNAAR